MVKAGKGGARDASTLEMDIVLAEEFEGMVGEGGTGEALVALHGQADQLVQPGLGREGGRRVGGRKEVGRRRSGGGGIADGVGGVGDEG